MAKTSPLKFAEEVRQEVGRVTWPSRKETTVTTRHGVHHGFYRGRLFFLVDQIFSAGVRLIFGLGH